MNNIGKVIKRTRKELGLNQKDFAQTLTVSQSYISNIENEREIPTPMFIKLFCLLYSIDEKSLKD